MDRMILDFLPIIMLLCASLIILYLHFQVRKGITLGEMQTKKLQEINERLKSEMDKRQAAEEKNAEAVRIKSDFISVVSHELRTPLTVIKGGIDVMVDEIVGTINAEQKDVLVTVKNNVDRLSRLINDVLDYQKLDSGRMKFVLKEHGLNALIESLAKDFKPMAEAKGLKLVLDLPAEKLVALFDKDKIIQVMFNLITNAFKFTDSGSVTIKAERIPNGYAKVSVIDEGTGIKPEDISKLFQSFSQLHSLQERKTGGTGLGLSISRKIIEGHNGIIDVESTPGKGSTFYFTLQLKA